MEEKNICKERAISEDYVDFIIPRDKARYTPGIEEGQVCNQAIGLLFQVAYIDRAYADPLRLDKYSYNAIPKCYSLLDMATLNEAGITQIQNYPTLQLKGEGVMLGFIDTGIDYENEIFRNLDGSTRIAGIWDQTIQTGTPPKGLYYGSEYTREDIDEVLKDTTKKEKVPTVDTNGHGTFLASIAAGGANVQEQFLGAAPESTIGVVKLKPAKEYLKEFYFIDKNVVCYQENDIMLGVRYLDELAAKYNLPLVVCIALGTNSGSHTGVSPLSQMLDIYSNKDERVYVVGTGNEANQRHHFTTTLKNLNDSKEVEIRVGDGVNGFALELWTDIPNILAVSLISPSGERIPRIPIKKGIGSIYKFVFERTELYIDYRILVENTNSELIFFRFDQPTSGIWKIAVEPLQLADGTFHMWLPMKEFISGEVSFFESNPYHTITEPGNTYAPMTTSYYNGEDNSIDINSGRGYTRNGGIKPDFASPGVNVIGMLPGGRYTKKTGSSIAVGIAAGASALLTQWIVNQLGERGVDSIQIKNVLILGTERKDGESYPNEEWGYGKLNLYNTFETIRKF